MRFRLLTLFLFMVLALPVSAQGPASTGITRDGIRSFLIEDGFDSPYFVEDYPPFDGEKHTSAHVPPGIDVELYGPDNGLTYVETRFRASDDENERYWQGRLAVQLLEWAFPNWASREQWMERVLYSGRVRDCLAGGWLMPCYGQSGAFLPTPLAWYRRAFP